MNKALEEKLKTLPRNPGVYFHKTKSGEIIYVGKAASLRNRVRQYFQSSRSLDTKTLALVNEIYDTDWVETDSEIDALFLESEMVKRYMPRYNILLRDDKSQTYVRIDMKNEWPHVSFTRNPFDDGADYFGPFYSGHALKKALRYLRRVYPYETRPTGRTISTLTRDIGLSPRREDGSDAYKKDLRRLISYIKGNRRALLKELENKMQAAAKQHRFEEAAKLRNKLRAMQELKRRITFGDKEFLDISKDKALQDVTALLGLKDVPARIEGYDVSHQGGKNVVASMVVFMNGVSDRSKYRKFKTSQRNDDVGNIYETIFRRFSETNSKKWGLPDLIIIDGGGAQLQSALRAMSDRDIKIPTVSIAKREEEIIVDRRNSDVAIEAIHEKAKESQDIHVYEQGDFVVINLHPRQTNAGGHSRNLRGMTAFHRYDDIVKLFQRIRDESHRFAVSYHTVLKRAAQTQSVLDTIPGIGPATKKKLISTFGGSRGVLAASEEDMSKVVGPAKAKLISEYAQKER